MRITSMTNLFRRTKNSYLVDFFTPLISGASNRENRGDLLIYEVQQKQDMRIDLVILDMYENDYDRLQDIDVILKINDINNPLNIYPGMKLYYPSAGTLQEYRLEREDSKSTETKKAMGIPNKSTKNDPNRKKYLDGEYSLPPTVRNTPVEPVRLTPDGQISVGGV